MTLLKNIRRSGHDDVVDALAQTLAARNWRIEREPIVAGTRPDLVATGPDGSAYVFEVKAGRLDANLGAVAQVEMFRNAWSQAHDDESVRGVLIVPDDAPAELDAIAGRADVEVVRASGPRFIDRSLTTAGVVAALPLASEKTASSPQFRPIG